jgi:hypothetical protein
MKRDSLKKNTIRIPGKHDRLFVLQDILLEVKDRLMAIPTGYCGHLQNSLLRKHDSCGDT